MPFKSDVSWQTISISVTLKSIQHHIDVINFFKRQDFCDSCYISAWKNLVHVVYCEQKWILRTVYLCRTDLEGVRYSSALDTMFSVRYRRVVKRSTIIRVHIFSTCSCSLWCFYSSVWIHHIHLSLLLVQRLSTINIFCPLMTYKQLYSILSIITAFDTCNPLNLCE